MTIVERYAKPARAFDDNPVRSRDEKVECFQHHVDLERNAGIPRAEMRRDRRRKKIRIAQPACRTHIARTPKRFDIGVDERRARTSRTSVCADASTGILTDLSLNDDERAHLERVVAVMSMLEGHADVVMDSAEEVLPATAAIRSRFNRRRHDTRGIQGLVRRLVGMDAKLRQYTDGAAFITEVVEHAGHAGVNLAFAHEGNLPTPHEISHPRDWVTRVVG